MNTQKKILIVKLDDEPDISNFFHANFREKGFVRWCANNGLED